MESILPQGNKMSIVKEKIEKQLKVNRYHHLNILENIR